MSKQEERRERERERNDTFGGTRKKKNDGDNVKIMKPGFYNRNHI